MDDLGVVGTIDGLGQSVVVAVADAAGRWFDPGFPEALAILDRNVLAAAVTVVDKAASMAWPTIMDRSLERIHHETGVCGSVYPSPQDGAGLYIDHERDIDEARPGHDIGKSDTNSMFCAGAWNCQFT